MPEISPELAARIESLRASHAENPARFFMPLASAYREGGEVGRAEELLRENLKRHPGYLSAHVLLGRCLADRGANAEARNEFQYVLSVDPQNLIALRTLGDMAAVSGDTGEARRWFGELLSVDPMNAEAKQALAGLDVADATAQAEAAASGEGAFGMVNPEAGDAPDADHPAATADPGSWGEVSLDAHPAFSAGDAPAAGEAAPPSFEALDFGAVDLSAGAQADEAPAADDQPSADEPAAAWDTVPAAAFQPDGLQSGEDTSDDTLSLDAPLDAPLSFEPAPDEPISFEPDDTTSDEPASDGPIDLEAPAAGGFDAWGSVDDGQDEVDAEAVEPLELETFYDLEPEAAPAAHAEEHEDHEEVVTETIAELYARQGFPDRAAGVYRELIGRRGEEPALVRRLQELEDQVRATEAAEEETAFEPLDLPGDLAADEIAAARADEPPSWLATVDAVVAGDAVTPLADAAGTTELPSDEPIDFAPSDERVDFTASDDADASAAAEPIAHLEVPAAPALTGDAFADSFANGFAGSADAPRQAWEAPNVAETEAPADGFTVPDEDVAAETPASSYPEQPSTGDEPPSVDEIQPAAASPTVPVAGARETIVAYLSAILSWRPGAARAVAEPSAAVSDDAGPPPARPWDDETLGASDEQPPIDEPWIAADAPSAEASHADAPWTVTEPAATESTESPEPAADEPWGAPAEPWAETPAPEPSPDAAPDESHDDTASAGEDLSWLTDDAGAARADAAASEAGEAPMPWETSFDISPEVPEDEPVERAAPRQEPTAGAGGDFSFEDFFSEPAAPAEPAADAPELEPLPLPEPAPPPAAAQPAPPAPAPDGGGDEDEDLESFQAWLQSLKR